MKNEAITIRREVALVERMDGQAISAAEPVACDCCGKLCTVRYFEMSNGARFGKDCAWIVDFMASQAPAQFTREQATFFRANKKQLAYLGL